MDLLSPVNAGELELIQSQFMQLKNENANLLLNCNNFDNSKKKKKKRKRSKNVQFYYTNECFNESWIIKHSNVRAQVQDCNGFLVFDGMQVISHEMLTQMKSEVPNAKKMKIERNKVMVESGEKQQEDWNEVEKYWNQRYRLFSMFDDGVEIDFEGWFSVTPEEISQHIAWRMSCLRKPGKPFVLVDAFCGVGGNTIQLAQVCDLVIAIEKDPTRIAMAKNNCQVYGVDHKVEFILGDFFEVLEQIPHADGIFLGPPWGGPSYLQKPEFQFQDINGLEIFEIAKRVSPNLAIILPRNSSWKELSELSSPSPCEVEKNYLHTKLKTITVYFGDLVGMSESCLNYQCSTEEVPSSDSFCTSESSSFVDR
jgi:trimethylguanosine synthase